MMTAIDILFKGYSLKEIEEILLKSVVEDFKKKKRNYIFSNVKNEIGEKNRLKM